METLLEKVLKRIDIEIREELENDRECGYIGQNQMVLALNEMKNQIKRGNVSFSDDNEVIVPVTGDDNAHFWVDGDIVFFQY